MKKILSIIVTGAFVTGCAQVTTENEWSKLKTDTRESNLVWVQTQKDEKIVAELITKTTQKPLDIEATVQVALINNSELQSTFENIGISKSELVQAGLFSNPRLSALFRFPTSGGRTNIEADGLLTVSDLWLLPLRKRVAEANMEKTLLHVANKVMETKRNARKAFVKLYFAQKLYQESLKFRQLLQDLSKEAKRRHKFGYVTEVDIHMTEVAAREADILVHEYDTEVKIIRGKLLNILGLQGQNTQLSDKEIPAITSIPTIGLAFEQAYTNRFDIQVAEMHVKEKARHIDLNSYMIFKDVNAGISLERESGGDTLVGPAVELELPLFDQNQAQISKAEFEWRKAKKDLRSLKQNITLNVESLLAKSKHLETKAETILGKIIPLQQKSVRFVNTWSNLMQINQFIFLQTQKDLMRSKMEHLKTSMELYQNFYELEYELGR